MSQSQHVLISEVSELNHTVPLPAVIIETSLSCLFNDHLEDVPDVGGGDPLSHMAHV